MKNKFKRILITLGITFASLGLAYWAAIGLSNLTEYVIYVAINYPEDNILQYVFYGGGIVLVTILLFAVYQVVKSFD